MSVYLVSPAQLFRGRNAAAEAAPAIAALGRRLLLVTGEIGVGRIGSPLDDAFTAAGASVSSVRHLGPCSLDAIASIVSSADRADADAIVGVGGGRVLDAAKAAADETGRRFAAIPTSPATCAAVTPLAVVYTPSGAYSHTRHTSGAPEVVALDPELLASAPIRLLVAGIVDATAKIHEVRYTSADAGRRSVTARAALTLCDDLERLIDRHAERAVASSDAGSADAAAQRASRELMAEACVLMPGLIGGLAGEDAKLAAAHPLHNALTLLPDSHRALHGELVGFGVLVQIALAGGGEEGVRREARRYARLGLACHLDALGCAPARAHAGAEIAARTVTLAPMRAAFPAVSAEALLDTMLQVDLWARDEAEASLVERTADAPQASRPVRTAKPGTRGVDG